MSERYTDSAFVVANDGVRLATDVYLPPAGPARVPAILLRTPYDMREDPTLFGRMGHLFAAQGFAFVAQDTRGRFRSGGIATPFENEAPDGWATLDWIVKQPWSNGAVGVTGDSYGGLTAMAAAASGHPAIRAAAITNTTSDVAGDWMRHQGVVRLQFLVSWAIAAWSGDGLALPDIPWGHRPLAELVAKAAPGRSSASLDRWIRGRSTSASVPDPVPDIGQAKLPMLLKGGWWDLFQRGLVRDWARHRKFAANESRLVMDATDHDNACWTDDPPAMRHADSDEAEARLASELERDIRFLRRHLAGRAPERSRVEWHQVHAGWCSADEWPPAGARLHELFLVDGARGLRGPEGGSLALRPDRIAPPVQWTHEPSMLVPSLEGDVVHERYRRPDERLVQVRPDVLTFTSAPLAADLDLAGPVAVSLAVATTAPGMHVMAKLTDVYPEGPARRVAEGAAAMARGAGGLVVNLGHVGYRVRPGHRLRLEVASSAYPRYIWHPGTDEDPWTAPTGRPATQTLEIGAESKLSLTTVDGDMGDQQAR